MIVRLLAWATLVAGVSATAVLTLAMPAAPDNHVRNMSDVSGAHARGPDRTLAGRYRGETAAAWARRFRHRSAQLRAARRAVRQVRRELLRRWDYPELLRLAAVAYGVDAATLERKARCESVNFTDFYNERSGASNVMQFLPSTWATTPYARFSIWNPFAAVLAGAWMHRVGRGDEWECP